MISSQKLIRLARKWQMLAGLRKKKISWPRVSSMKNDSCSSSSTVSKGHFVLYSIDGRRFEIALKYLQNQIVAELLQAAEEEFGVARNGPLTLSCDGVLVEYVLSLVGRVEICRNNLLLPYLEVTVCHIHTWFKSTDPDVKLPYVVLDENHQILL